MPITADTVTIAQFLESEANVDLVTELTVNASAQVLLATPIGQNDNRMSYQSFLAWTAGTGDLVASAGGYVLGTEVVDSANIAPGAVGSAQLGSKVVDTGNIADTAVGNLQLGTSVVDNRVLGDNSVGAANIVDANVTLAKLFSDALTNLTNTPAASTVEIESSTGQPTTLPAATVTTAGVMASEDKGKLVDTVYVTDFGADATGVAPSSTAINAAISFAITNTIHRIAFPKGKYLIDAPIVLPHGSLSADYWRFEIDLGGSQLIAEDVIVFDGTVATVAEANGNAYSPVIRNGFIKAQTAGQGTGIALTSYYGLRLEGVRCEDLAIGIKVTFGLWGSIANCNMRNCTDGLIINSGIDEGLADATPANSNSNVMQVDNTRVQTFAATQRGVTVSNSANVGLDGVIVEGSSVETAWVFQGAIGNINHNIRMERCFNEFSSVANAIFQLSNMIESDLWISQHYFNNFVADTLVMKLVNRVEQCHITWANTAGFNKNGLLNQTAPWFDANIDPNIDDRNRWVFIENALPSGSSFLDTARWTSAEVPQNHDERTHHPDNDSWSDSTLTVPANSMLANDDAVNDAIVKPLSQGSLSTAPRNAGATVLGWDDSGNLAEFDAQVVATSRKDGVDDLGTTSGTLAINFDTGIYDNKLVTVNGTTDISFVTGTRLGSYELWLKQDATGFHPITNSTSTLEPKTDLIPVNPDSNQVTVIRFRWDGTSWHWG